MGIFNFFLPFYFRYCIEVIHGWHVGKSWKFVYVMSISGVRFPMPLVKHQFWFDNPRYFNGRKLLLHGRGSLFESGSRDFYGVVAQWSTALVLHTSIYRGFESHQLQIKSSRLSEIELAFSSWIKVSCYAHLTDFCRISEDLNKRSYLYSVVYKWYIF